MILRGKISRKLMAAATLACGLLIVPCAAASGTEVKSATIGGNSATLVYFTMGGGRTGEVTLAGNSVAKDQSAAKHIEQKKADGNKNVVASINGGYFNSYYSTSKAITFPSNAPVTYATVIQNGLVINGGGNKPTLAFTNTGKPLIDRVKIETSIVFRGDQKVTAWSVNEYYSDASAVSLFTTDLGYPVSIPSTAKMVYIQNNVVTQIINGTTLTVPAGNQVMVFNQGAWNNMETYFIAPRIGNSAERVTDYTPQTGSADEWSTVVNGVGAGPILLLNGQDATGQNSDFTEAKQSVTTSSARSFAAVMNDGRLVLGVATASPKAIATYLQSAGARDAMALDGGASSMLHYNGSFVRSAGRSLSNVLHIVDYNAGAIPQGVAAANLDAPSDWAQSTIQQAISKNLIDSTLQGGYQKNITRKEFCILVIDMLKTQQGDDAFSKLVYATDVAYDDAKFTDCHELRVVQAFQLGLVNGTAEKVFDPNASLTREMGAKILASAAQIMGVQATGSSISFSDAASISSWAKDSVDFVCRAGIMNGSGTAFKPADLLTREEAIAMIARITS